MRPARAQALGPTQTPALGLALGLALALAGCGAARAPVGPAWEGPADAAGSVDGGAATVAADGGAPLAFEMQPLAPSTMVAELRAAGLDPAHLPVLGALEPAKLRKVMPLFARALGAKCSDCHLDDPRAPTARKQIAEKMWNDYVRLLAVKDGSPVFCDACHRGRRTFLDRRDAKALGRWMDENLARGLRRRDGLPHDCPTCHGDDMVPRFLDPLRR